VSVHVYVFQEYRSCLCQTSSECSCICVPGVLKLPMPGQWWVFMYMCSRSIEVAYARPVVSVHVYVFQEYWSCLCFLLYYSFSGLSIFDCPFDILYLSNCFQILQKRGALQTRYPLLSTIRLPQYNMIAPPSNGHRWSNTWGRDEQLCGLGTFTTAQLKIQNIYKTCNNPCVWPT
jgi:hypothetical protein